jgi:hypothetical protein
MIQDLFFAGTVYVSALVLFAVVLDMMHPRHHR